MQNASSVSCIVHLALSIEMQFPILTSLVALPIAGAILLLFVRDEEGNAALIRNIALVVSVLVFALIGTPDIMTRILSRIVLIPVIAGIAYEIIRFAARHMDSRVVRVLMRPGLALQQLTTREPTLDQLEVAIASLRAVMTAEQLAEVEARVPVPAGVPRPAFGTA